MSKAPAKVGLFHKLDSRRAIDVPNPAPAALPEMARKVTRPASREGKRALTVYVSSETWRALRQIGLDEGLTIQALVGEALDLLARQRGKHPFGER